MDNAAARPGSGRGLLVVVLVLALSVALLAVLVWRTHEQRTDTRAGQERYAEVLAAASQEADAFVNIRYDDAQAGIDAVAAGATGRLRRQYGAGGPDVVDTLRRNRSVMEGEVLRAGVVALSADTATVLVATTGTLTSRQTDQEPVDRDFRLRLDLVREGDRWLTGDLEVLP